MFVRTRTVTLELPNLSRSLFLGLGVATFALAGCGEGNEPEEPPPAVAAVEVSPNRPVLVAGQSVRLVATPRDEEGRPVAGKQATWTSSDSRIAVVNGPGEVEARGTGEATITATIDGKAGSATVVVSPIPVASLLVSPSPTSVAQGQTVQLVATARDAEGNELPGRVVAWASADPAIATVSADGLVTGAASGRTTITATSEARSASAEITVGAPLTAPVITTLSPAIAVAGDPALLVTIAGTGFDAGSKAMWNGAVRPTTFISGRELQVQLEAADLAQAGSSRVSVTGSSSSVTSNELAFMVSAGVASIEIQGASPLWRGGILPLAAVARDANGRPLPGRQFIWRSHSGVVASVDDKGVVQALASGETVVTATAGGVVGSATIAVAVQPDHDILFSAVRGGRPSIVRQVVGDPDGAQALFADGRFALQPAISPDGARIAYVALTNGNYDIWVAERDGRNPRRLTSDAAVDEQPAWSPDGTRIAFRSQRNVDGSDIWVMDADGRNQEALTRNALAFGGLDVSHPTWSPDGRTIVFAQGSSLASPFRSVLMSIRADGTGLRQLTDRPGYSDGHPSFSPDGRTIAIERRQVGSSRSDILLLLSDGRELIMPFTPGEGRAPRWSPDGTWLAFLAPDGDVYLNRPGEQHRFRATFVAHIGGAESPTWLGQ